MSFKRAGIDQAGTNRRLLLKIESLFNTIDRCGNRRDRAVIIKIASEPTLGADRGSNAMPIHRRCLSFGDWQVSVELESDFWDCLQSIAEQQGISVDRLAYDVGSDFVAEDLAAPLRVFVLTHFRDGDFPSVEMVDEGRVENRSTAGLAFRQKYH